MSDYEIKEDHLSEEREAPDNKLPWGVILIVNACLLSGVQLIIFPVAPIWLQVTIFVLRTVGQVWVLKRML